MGIQMAALSRMARPAWLVRAASLLPQLAAAQVSTAEPLAGGAAATPGTSVCAAGEEERTYDGMEGGEREGGGVGEGSTHKGGETEGRSSGDVFVTRDGEGTTEREAHGAGNGGDVPIGGCGLGDDDDAGMDESEEDEYADAEGGALALENMDPNTAVRDRNEGGSSGMDEGDGDSDKEEGTGMDDGEQHARGYPSSSRRHTTFSLNLRALQCLANFTEPEPATASTDVLLPGTPMGGDQVSAQEIHETEGGYEDCNRECPPGGGECSSRSPNRKRRADGGDGECRGARPRSGSSSSNNNSSGDSNKADDEPSQQCHDTACGSASVLMSGAAGPADEGDDVAALRHHQQQEQQRQQMQQQRQWQENQQERQAAPALRSAFEVVARVEERSGPGGGPRSAAAGGGRAAMSLWGAGGFSLGQSGDGARQWDGVVRRLRVPGSCYSKLPVDLTGMSRRVDSRARGSRGSIGSHSESDNSARVEGGSTPVAVPVPETSLFQQQGMSAAGPQVHVNEGGDGAGQHTAADEDAAATVVAPGAGTPADDASDTAARTNAHATVPTPGLSSTGVATSVRSMEGLWAGVFGPHGVEILHTRVVDGELLATKIIGEEEKG